MSEVQLLRNDTPINSLFNLLGDKENDITFSLAWFFSKNEKFLSWFLKEVIGDSIKYQKVDINLQKYDEKYGGYTDIEIVVDNDWFIIVEAKKGWNLPTKRQIRKYMKRKKHYPSFRTLFVVLSDCDQEYAIKEVKKYQLKAKVISVSWEKLFLKLNRIRELSNNYQKQLINELEKYLKGVISMDNVESNKVFCVALSRDKAVGSHRISFLEVVTKKKKYFYPVGKGWPSPPPTYIAFRIDAKLLSIHYVKKYDIVTNFHKYIPEIPSEEFDPFYLLWLDTPFGPKKEVKNGNIYANQHLWFMIDTIFTSKTIKEARDKTKRRPGI